MAHRLKQQAVCDGCQQASAPEDPHDDGTDVVGFLDGSAARTRGTAHEKRAARDGDRANGQDSGTVDDANEPLVGRATDRQVLPRHGSPQCSDDARQPCAGPRRKVANPLIGVRRRPNPAEDDECQRAAANYPVARETERIQPSESWIAHEATDDQLRGNRNDEQQVARSQRVAPCGGYGVDGRGYRGSGLCSTASRSKPVNESNLEATW